jgi:benzoate/toluate 1,2-dioxygenase alpha subunit
VYESVQAGLRARSAPAVGLGHMRGFGQMIRGPDDFARQIGITPLTSSYGRSDAQDETVFHGSYREWARRIKAGLANEVSA